ncbi:metallophosphoesterase [Chloropicon primus]|uniref:Purple acid phosphatase n=1 Tax=Chloropicon primus TaxID=1764295 RepID=A0A5B8MFJ1_9CHLO|nr:metallophosphoesterase [Chloropicon primus]|eukprot:QDZ18090.1 metallophosphoesterase [Chloropicon primus]
MRAHPCAGLIVAALLLLPHCAVGDTVGAWARNATTQVASRNESVSSPLTVALEEAGDEIPAAAPETALQVHDVSEDPEEEYQLPKTRQREARRGGTQRGLGTRIVDGTRPEGVVSVEGLAHPACGRSNNVVLTPYLQSAGSTRMVVRWRTSGQGAGVVCFGKSPKAMTSVAKEDGKQWPMYAERKDVETWDTVHAADHLVVLEGLDPLATYYYAVGTEVPTQPEYSVRSAKVSIPSSRYYSFTTFPEPGAGVEEPVRVWAIGDSGWGDHKAKRVRDAFVNFTGGDWDLTLGLGDLAYLRGKDWEYQKRFFNYLSEENARVPVFTTPGNHDAFTADMKLQTGPYFDLFTNPGDGRSGGVPSDHKSYYSFDYGPIHFVSVDSDTLGLHDDPALYAWLEKDLAEARRADYQWIVAYHHQPPYSKGSHDSDAQYECYKLRSNLVPMFEKYGVDLVLAGHSHSYERSHLLSGHFGPSGEVRSNPGVVKARWSKGEDGVETLVKTGEGENSGTLYIVSGGGAIRGGGPLDHPAMAFSHKNRGSTLLEFDKDELRIWLLGEHRDDKDDYAGYTVILDEAKVIKKKAR